MSARADVLLWAQRVLGRKGAAAHQILEIAPGATPEVAQEAFHRIARMAHPDLHRRTLPPDELELVTTAYARAAAAYHELRSQRARPQPTPPSGVPGSASPSVPAPARRAPGSSPAPGREPDAPAAPGHFAHPAQSMTSKALIYYRKAELALRRGDLRGAVLQLKMAIASDPQSTFLRSALAEVEAEVGKNP